MLYEFDIYAELAIFFARTLRENNDLRLYVNYGRCDLVLVEVEEKAQRSAFRDKYKSDLRKMHYEDLIKRYLIYFEIKFIDYTIQDLLQDLDKLHSSLFSPAWKKRPEKLIFVLFATALEFQRFHQHKEYQKRIRDTRFSNKYLELRGYPDFTSKQEKWGLYYGDGSEF